MAAPIFQRTIVDSDGNVEVGATVEVRNEANNELAAIYVDRELTVAKANPFITDETGLAQFFVSRGEYNVKASKGDLNEITWRYVQMLDTEFVASTDTEQTLTNKTINLANNTLVATSAQLRAAITDETGTGSAVFSISPALTGTPTVPTATAGTNTTQAASTAYVIAERTNEATLTNKTLTSPTINTPTGIVKGDVGLGNVDNTADSAKVVASAAKLTTARTIGGVSFDGTANINLPGVNATGNQDTTGTAANVTGTVAVANGGTGRTSLTTGNVVLGAGTSAVNFVAPGTSGNVLTSNGLTWVSSSLPGVGGAGSFSTLEYTGTLTGGTGVVNLGSGQFYKDASGNVGFGTSSPTARVHSVVPSGSYASGTISAVFESTSGRATARLRSIADDSAEFAFDVNGSLRWLLSTRASAENYRLHFYTQPSSPSYGSVTGPAFEIQQDGQRASSGPGYSLRPEFQCRAWVNFNGTGTVAIRASGNVSSITDEGTGNYRVNFTTAMPDTNYAPIASGYDDGVSPSITKTTTPNTTSQAILVCSNSSNTLVDIGVVTFCVFR